MTDSLSAHFDRQLFLTVGGTETFLQFLQRFPLRGFCAFELLDDDRAFAELEQRYLFPIVDAALEHGHGLLADALVWRASVDHVSALGYGPGDVARFNRLGVARMRAALEARRARTAAAASAPLLIAGEVGPRGDGYQVPSGAVEISAAFDYHSRQVEALARAEVDLVTALTMTTVNEAVGIARAAIGQGLPLLVSPTVETDGRLPDGTTLGDFIERVDQLTGGAPTFYMVNCAHPVHLLPVLEQAAREERGWLRRFRGFRANASDKSHAELDDSPSLDRGDPHDLGTRLGAMQRTYDLRVVGGCCGTDAEHIAMIAQALDG